MEAGADWDLGRLAVRRRVGGRAVGEFGIRSALSLHKLSRAQFYLQSFLLAQGITITDTTPGVFEIDVHLIRQ